MREMEALFRAKTLRNYEYGDEYIDCGEWVDGFYVCLNGEEHRIYTGYAETDCGDYYPDYFSVDPETVRKYTGLCDKNGNMIFEDDIIKRTWNGSTSIYRVVFDNCLAAFIGEVKPYGQFTTFDGDGDEFEIIGNVHDNPELLNI